MGRRPLRSSLAPTMRPSLKISAAGPSQGSCSRVAFCRKRRSFGPVCGSLSHAGGTMRSIAAARPAAIGTDGIDLTVVRDESERLRELPRRAGVGGIALVKNCEGRDEILAGQVRVKSGELQRREQSFIYKRLRRQRAKINSGERAGFYTLAHQEKLALQIRRGILRGEKALPNQRQGSQRAGAKKRRIGRHFTPAEAKQSHFCGGSFHVRVRHRFLARRNKRHAHAERFGQLNIYFAGALADEIFRNRSENAGAVAAEPVSVNSATMTKPLQSSEGALDHIARAAAAQLGDEADSAGIVVHFWLGTRRPHDR